MNNLPEKIEKPIDPVIEVKCRDEFGRYGKLDLTPKQLNALQQFSPTGFMTRKNCLKIIEENKE